MSPTVKKKTASKDIVKKELNKEGNKEGNKEVPKKKVTKKRVTKKQVEGVNNPPVKKVTKKSVITASKSRSLKISPEERWKMVAVAAYHKAEKRNFEPGYEFQDWIDSENEIDKLLHK